MIATEDTHVVEESDAARWPITQFFNGVQGERIEYMMAHQELGDWVDEVPDDGQIKKMVKHYTGRHMIRIGFVGGRYMDIEMPSDDGKPWAIGTSSDGGDAQNRKAALTSLPTSH